MESFGKSEVAEFFGSLELFKDLPAEARERLAGSAKVKKFSAGELIMQSGGGGDSMYLVGQGKVRVTLEGAKGHKDMSVLERGAVVGEMALLKNVRRTATITAQTECVLIELAAREVLPLCEKYPSFKACVEGTVAKRSKQMRAKQMED